MKKKMAPQCGAKKVGPAVSKETTQRYAVSPLFLSRDFGVAVNRLRAAALRAAATG